MTSYDTEWTIKRKIDPLTGKMNYSAYCGYSEDYMNIDGHTCSSSYNGEIAASRQSKPNRLSVTVNSYLGPFRVSHDRSVGVNRYIKDEVVLKMYYRTEEAANQYINLMLEDTEYEELIQYMFDTLVRIGDVTKSKIEKVKDEYERMVKIYNKYRRNEPKYIALCEQKVKMREYREICRREYPEFVKYFD